MITDESEPVPVEKGFPLLGVLPKLFTGNPFEYLKNIMIERGDLVKLNFGLQPVYLVSSPEYLQRILRDNYLNYVKPEMFYSLAREVAGNGLITSSGDFWLRQRRMIQPHLHRSQLANLFSDMLHAITETVGEWETLAQNNTEVELSEKMGEISMNVITRTMFGEDILSPAEIAEIGLSISRITKYMGETLYSSMLPKWVPIPGRRQFEHDRTATQETVNQIITKCRQNKDTSASLIQMLINSVDEESHEHMTEKQLFDEVLTVFVAGFETNATALTWLGVVIHQHPEILEKLRAEIDRVIGERIPSFEDIRQLTYTRQVVMEILRIYSISPFLPRTLNKADQLGKYHLPANSLLLMFYYGLHHNPRVWEKPDVFDPERFTPERMAGMHSFAYMPFSAGPRKCAGDEFAMLVSPLTIAIILQKYDINVLPNQTFTPHIGATVRPSNGVKVTFSRRNLASV